MDRHYLKPDADTYSIYFSISCCVMMGPTSGAKNSRIQSVVKHFESFSIHQSGKNEREQAVDPHCWEASFEVLYYLEC